jgi:hypothetical protein
MPLQLERIISARVFQYFELVEKSLLGGGFPPLPDERSGNQRRLGEALLGVSRGGWIFRAEILPHLNFLIYGSWYPGLETTKNATSRLEVFVTETTASTIEKSVTNWFWEGSRRLADRPHITVPGL